MLPSHALPYDTAQQRLDDVYGAGTYTIERYYSFQSMALILCANGHRFHKSPKHVYAYTTEHCPACRQARKG